MSPVIMLYMRTDTGHLPRRASAAPYTHNGHLSGADLCVEKSAGALRTLWNGARAVPGPVYMIGGPLAAMGLYNQLQDSGAEAAEQQVQQGQPRSRLYSSQLEADMAAHNRAMSSYKTDKALQAEVEAAQKKMETEGQDSLTNKLLGNPEPGEEFSAGRIGANLALNFIGAEDMYSAYRNFQKGNVLSGLGNVATGVIGLVPGIGWAGKGALMGAKMGLKGVAAARAVAAAGKARKAWNSAGAVSNIARQAAKPMSRTAAAWNELRPGARTIQANKSMSISNPVQYGMEHTEMANRVLPNRFSFLKDTASPGGAFNHVAVPVDSGAFTRGMAGTYNWLGSQPWARAQRAAPMLGTFNRAVSGKPAQWLGYGQMFAPAAFSLMPDNMIDLASPLAMKADVDLYKAQNAFSKAQQRLGNHRAQQAFSAFGDDRYGRAEPQQQGTGEQLEMVGGNYDKHHEQAYRQNNGGGKITQASVQYKSAAEGAVTEEYDSGPLTYLGKAPSMNPLSGVAVPQYKPGPEHIANMIVQSEPGSFFSQEKFAPFIYKYIPQFLPGILNDTASEIARSAKPTMNLKSPAYMQAMLASSTFADRRFNGYPGIRPSPYEQYR